MKIDAVLSPPEIALLPSRDLTGTTCVVFDVLRATSTIVTALAHGALEIHPARTICEAWEIYRDVPDAVLGGERNGERIEGFQLGNSPLEYRGNAPGRIITTTTNGTIALRACDGAREILAAAILNIEATRRHIADAESVLLVCAGTFETLAGEDVIAAGMLCAEFPEAELTDAAAVALAAYNACRDDIPAALRQCRNGRTLVEKGREAEIDWCAQLSLCDVVAIQEAGRVAAAPDRCIG